MARPHKPQEHRAKRREIYATDREWTAIVQAAQEQGVTISRYLVAGRPASISSRNSIARALFDLGRMQAQIEEIAATATCLDAEEFRLLAGLARIEGQLADIAREVRLT